MRSLCAGQARVPSHDELKMNKHAFKELMGAWTAQELILGAHNSVDVQRDNVGGVRPLRKFMAWGHAMMDSSAFAAATRSMGLSAHQDSVLSAMKVAGEQRYHERMTAQARLRRVCR